MSVLAIAHRAGNDARSFDVAAAAGADVVEADVHRYGGQLELRHGKALRPFPLLWDEGRLSGRRPAPPPLAWLLEKASDGPVVMLDLKGPGHVGRHVGDALGSRPGPPVLVCSRWWRGLDVLVDVPRARRVLTARTPVELSRLRRRVPREQRLHGVSLHRDLLRPDVVEDLRRHVALVMTWPVNDAQALGEVLGHGCNGVISDDLGVLAAVVAGP